MTIVLTGILFKLTATAAKLMSRLSPCLPGSKFIKGKSIPQQSQPQILRATLRSLRDLSLPKDLASDPEEELLKFSSVSKKMETICSC
jgi:hypothetical protein